MEGDAIWIECIPEEVGASHIEALASTVTGTNVKY